jgi:hypothetical protein
LILCPGLRRLLTGGGLVLFVSSGALRPWLFAAGLLTDFWIRLGARLLALGPAR